MDAKSFDKYFATGHLLAVLPVSRVHLEYDPISFPRGTVVCPPGGFTVASLQIRPNAHEGVSLAEAQSAATGIDAELLTQHPLVVFPCHFDWAAFDQDSHKNHLRFIRTLSQYADATFLDVARFSLCRLGLVDTLPGRAGSLTSNPMFAAAAMYNPALRQARLIAGAAFTHSITVGLGLPLEPCEERHFPRQGEVGAVARHGLALYRNALEASDHTSRFVSVMTLFEFLANPDDYETFKSVKKILARYVSRDRTEYEQWLEWFFDLTGRKAPTGEIAGIRTRIVHLGHSLEDCLDDDGIIVLYRKLEIVVGKVLLHMIEHSELDWNEYQTLRSELGPFAS